MKATTTAGQLHDTIAVAAMITPSRPQLAAYGGVLLTSTRGRLSVRGTNGDTTVTCMSRVSDTEEGSALVPPGPISKYLAALDPQTQVVVHAPSQTQVVVTAAGSKPYKFTALADSFPAASVPRHDKVEADLSLLADAATTVASCAETMAGLPEKVVQLVSDANGLRLHATDNFRVARAALASASGFGEFDGLLPLRVLNLVASIQPTHVQVDPRGRTLVFHAETTIISTRLVQEPFPVVDSVLAAAPPHTVTLEKASVLAALKRLAAVVPAKGAVKISIVSDVLTLEVPASVSGAGEEQVHLQQGSEAELDTAVSFEFLRSVLESHKSEVVTLGWSGPQRPLFFSSASPVLATHAVMPVRID